MNFWDFETWGLLNVIAVILLSLIVANILKRSVGFIKKSLIPTSVIGGLIILVISTVYKVVTGDLLFNLNFFGGNGKSVLEVITYHSLALGFISSALKVSNKKFTGKRGREIFDSGVTTVAVYVIQGIFGLLVTIIISFIVTDFFKAAGIILPFGFGQGTGQALNYGTMFENNNGFQGGKDFGLTVAALGFLSASIGGVIYLNVMKKKGRFTPRQGDNRIVTLEEVESPNEISMSGDMDKFTAQIIFISIAYLLTYGAMWLLGKLLPGMIATIYGFNFLLGVIFATLVKAVLKFLNKKNIVKKQYINNFLLNRISNTCFDIMVVAGIAAIDLTLIVKYWYSLLILAVVGLVVTYIYNVIVARTLFKEYPDEQFLAMYGMLTGTASTGVMLLREVDPEFKTPVQDNLVYQSLPAIVFGLPMLLIAPMTPEHPYLILGVLVAYFIILNLILFRSKIFPKLCGKKQEKSK